MSRHIYVFACASVIAVSVVACSKSGADGASPAAAQGQPSGGGAGAGRGAGGAGGRGGRGGAGGPVPVTTAFVAKKAIPVTIPAVGSAEALQTVQIRAQVTGQLSEVHFVEGQEVTKAQELFTLDPRPFQASLAQAQAVLTRDTATANNAARQRANYEDLYKRQLISRDQYETQVAQTESAQATIEADKAAVETARLNLQYTHITAPIGGRTGSLGVHQGDLIRANDANPMVVINQLSPIYVTFAVPGRYLTDIRRYQAHKPLSVRAQGQAALPPGAQPPPPPVLGSMPAQQQTQAQARAQSQAAAADAAAGITAGASETGRVTFIDNAVDNTTGTIKLKATFDNADHGLWPGQFLTVTLDLTTENDAIVVPAAAVQPSQAGQYVYVVKPDKSVEMRPVVIVRQQGEQMVIAQGLTPGEEVVTEGQLRLTPGAKVTTGGPGGGPAQGGGGEGAGNRKGGGGGRNGGGGRRGTGNGSGS
jgi:membrane fusion protein, multidrug efflux system